MHEIGFAIVDGRPVCWRWVGRRGQPRVQMVSVRLAAVRDDEAGTTVYEAAIPLSELQPLLPEVFGMAGAAVVLNDADAEDRESYLESSPGALTAGKHPNRFASLVFEPPSREEKKSGGPAREWTGMVWHNTVMPDGGSIALDVYARAWEAEDGKVRVHVTPAGSSHGYPAEHTASLAIGTDPEVRSLSVAPGVPPGEYRLEVKVLSEAGRTVIEDTAPLYVYPE